MIRLEAEYIHIELIFDTCRCVTRAIDMVDLFNRKWYQSDRHTRERDNPPLFYSRKCRITIIVIRLTSEIKSANEQNALCLLIF